MGTRITVFAGAVAALLSTLLAAVLATTVNRLAGEYLRGEVTASAEQVAAELQKGQVINPKPYGNVDFVQVVDPSGTVVASTPRVEGRPQPIAAFKPSAGTGIAYREVCDGALPGCHLVVARSVSLEGRTWLVYCAAPDVPPLVHPRLAALLGLGVVVLTAVTAFGCRRVLRSSLRPVNAIRAELDTINASCPERRVPVPPGQDEFSTLAHSVNHTLDRLQVALEQQRQFASDASHDLRSPITAMRAQVEDALLAPEETRLDVIGDNLLVSLDRLQAIVCDLLMVARLDAGTPGGHEVIDLSALVAGELSGRQTSKKLKPDLEPNVIVEGDPLRLSRLLINLLDNAERHADTAICVAVRKQTAEPGDRRFPHGVAVMEVLDDGPGIERDKWEQVFQRFTRLPAARHKDSGGTGLGLAIARQIAELSGGTLSIEPSDQGARFVLRLPLSGASPPPHRPTAMPTCP
ncbi:HAMP domain-containing sensor histidine kinase [Sphaerisporangium sp. B11E5]|uniref:sensor histidine kinase n=1 Tax=Sphaerisporangium sp. B11E5 TaxID=3153563 RepID=UPI00325D874E